jgi:hypothetical protein
MHLRKLQRPLTLSAALVVGTVLGVTVLPTVGGQAATAKVYSLTVSGTDMHSLDASAAPTFVLGGGVAAQATGLPAGGGGANSVFEVGLSLPVGAKVTSLSVSYAGNGDNVGSYILGSYSPTTLNTVPVLDVGPPNVTTMGTVTKTGNPILTVAAGRHYVLDWLWQEASGGKQNSLGVFYGGTIKYTCVAPCTP